MRTSAALAWIVSAMVLFAFDSRAATICVNEGGTGSCLSSIQAAVTAASPGDTIAVRGGTYYENVTIPAGRDGLILRGSGTRSILDAEDPYATIPLVGVGITVFSSGVTIRNFTIRNGLDDGILVDTTASGTVLRQLSITGSNSDCVSSTGPGTQILKSKLRGCGSVGISITAADALVSGVSIDGADSGCLEITGNGAVVEQSRCNVSEDDDCFSITGNDAQVSSNRANACDGDGFNVSGDNWRIEKNRANATGDDGFALTCVTCATAVATKNYAKSTPDDSSGFSITSTGAVIEANRADDITDQGLEVTGNGNTVRRNVVQRVGGDEGEECIVILGNENEVDRNSASVCHGNGFAVTGDDNVLTRNTVSLASESGFQVTSGTGNLLERNTAKNVNYYAFEIEAGATATELVNDRATGTNRADLCDEGTGTVNSSPKLDDIATAPCVLPAP
jgi:parallel beta-helix repeat protein